MYDYSCLGVTLVVILLHEVAVVIRRAASDASRCSSSGLLRTRAKAQHGPHVGGSGGRFLMIPDVPLLTFGGSGFVVGGCGYFVGVIAYAIFVWR